MNKTLLLAGLGGTLPTLSKLAGSFAIQPEQPLPHWHISLALAVFFLIGCVLNISLNKENDLTKAIIVGISAPGLITNIVAGATTTPPTRIAIAEPHYFSYFIQPAHATEASRFDPAETKPASTSEQKKILIRTFAADAGQRDLFRNRALVIATVNGRQTKIGEIGVGDSSLFEAPPDTSAITLVAYGQNGSATRSIDLPSTEKSIQIDAKFDVQTTGAGDLQWAFGAPRQVSIVKIDLMLEIRNK